MANIIKLEQVEKEYRKKILFAKQDNITTVIFNKNRSLQTNEYEITKDESISLESTESIVRCNDKELTDQIVYTTNKETLSFAITIKKAPILITFKKLSEKALSFSLKNVITSHDTNKTTETTYVSESRNIEGIGDNFMMMVIYPAACCPPIIKIYPAMDDELFKSYKPNINDILAFDDASKCLYGSYDNPIDIFKREITSSATPGVKLVNPTEYIGSISELRFRNYDEYFGEDDGNNYRTYNTLINLGYINYSQEVSFTSKIDHKVRQYTINKAEVLRWNGIDFAGSLKFKNENGEVKVYNNIISEILLPFYNGDKKDDIDLEFAASLFKFPHEKFEVVGDMFNDSTKVLKKIIQIEGENCKILFTTCKQGSDNYSTSTVVLVGNDTLELGKSVADGSVYSTFSINKNTDYSNLKMIVNSYSDNDTNKTGSIVGSISFENIFDKQQDSINYYIYNNLESLSINDSLIAASYDINSESIKVSSDQCLINIDKDTLLRGPFGLLFKIKDIPNFF